MVSVSASVAWWARTEPQRLALVYGDVRLSYAQLQQRVERAAALLAARGVRAGDVVALLMKNSAAFLELSLAISHVGAVFLPVNYRLGRDEVDYIAAHAQVHVLFADEELRASVPDALQAIWVSEAAQHDSGVLSAGEQLAPVPPHPSRPDDLYRLMYTSGTTDRPKGVMHSYGNMAWKCLDHITALGLGKSDKLLVVGPLYHVGAFDLPGVHCGLPVARWCSSATLMPSAPSR